MTNQKPAQAFKVAPRLIRKRELLTMLPFSAATLHRKVRAGDFPAPIKLGPRISAYSVEAVTSWLLAKGDAK